MFDLALAVKAFVILLLGGAGTVLGPVVGAFAVELLANLTWSKLLNWHLGSMGLIIIAVVLAAGVLLGWMVQRGIVWLMARPGLGPARAVLGAFHGPGALTVGLWSTYALAQSYLSLARPILNVLDPAQAADQNAFAVTKNFAEDNDLHTLSDLKAYKGKLVLGGPPECPKRPFCQLGLEEKYGIKFTGFLSLDTGGALTKAALKSGKVQIGLVFSTDSSLSSLS